jgi:hypothetical protein
MTDIGICNLALGWLGADLITGFSDGTVEARLAEANYEAARDAVLEDRYWSFARGRWVLPALAGVDLDDWSAAFQLPSEVLRVYRVDDGSFTYLTKWEKRGRLLYADKDGPVTVFGTKREADTSLYSPNFCHAVAARLAMDLAMPLTGGKTTYETMAVLYESKLKNATGTDGTQGRVESVRASTLADRRR